MTCTPPAPAPSNDAALAEPPHAKLGPVPQGRVGPVITGLVTASSAANHSSCESSTTAPDRTGSTHEKSCGLPEYLIWSQRTVWRVDTENAIRWSVTTVVSVGGAKQPPHARACLGAATSADAATSTVNAMTVERRNGRFTGFDHYAPSAGVRPPMRPACAAPTRFSFRSRVATAQFNPRRRVGRPSVAR